ncbi:MAG: HpsJ family protein [Limnothrix sp.]
MNSARLASFTSLSLKILGAVLILSSLVDYLLAALPLMPLEDAWQINFTNQVVSRGINPMIGIVALMVASWVDFNGGKFVALKPAITDVKFLSFILSIILGVIFLLLIPLHLDNLQEIRDQSISQIEQQTQQQEQQVQAQFNELQVLAQSPEAKQQLDEQIKAIDEALNSGQVPPQQLETVESRKQELLNFQRFANDPSALDARLEELRGQVEENRTEQQKSAENTVLKEATQIGLRSLILGFGYLILGWVGLQNAFGNNTDRPLAATEPVVQEPTVVPPSTPEE